MLPKKAMNSARGRGIRKKDGKTTPNQCRLQKKVHDEKMNGDIIHNTMVIIPIITNSHLS